MMPLYYLALLYAAWRILPPRLHAGEKRVVALYLVLMLLAAAAGAAHFFGGTDRSLASILY